MYAKIFEFAASAGAFEGYVFQKGTVEVLGMKVLSAWVDNIEMAYFQMPDAVRGEFQDSCDGTIGRAIHSLKPLLGEKHALIEKLNSMVKGKMPASADDFSKKKWFQD